MPSAADRLGRMSTEVTRELNNINLERGAPGDMLGPKVWEGSGESRRRGARELRTRPSALQEVGGEECQVATQELCAVALSEA